jgi:Na+/H+ antiporter NhaD/arsenite permease-like protein
MWAVGLAFLLALFYAVDLHNYHRAPKTVRAHLAEPHDQWRFEGLPNIFFLLVILGAVFINQPLFLREALMIGAAMASYYSTWEKIHDANHFTFHPIQEVAILFVGIFATMMPALDWLALNSRVLLGENPGPGLFYWGTGVLSSVLDNAPTYLGFLTASFGTFVDAETVGQVQNLIQTHGSGAATLAGPHAEQIRMTFSALQTYHASELARGAITPEQIETAFLLGDPTFNKYIVAISVGAVFFGANTYIGNGPNFMVKSIADHQKVHAPGFIGYIFKFTLPCMLPMLLLVWWLFFRR